MNGIGQILVKLAWKLIDAPLL